MLTFPVASSPKKNSYITALPFVHHTDIIPPYRPRKAVFPLEDHHYFQRRPRRGIHARDPRTPTDDVAEWFKTWDLEEIQSEGEALMSRKQCPTH
jgi:hypothetical protein